MVNRFRQRRSFGHISGKVEYKGKSEQDKTDDYGGDDTLFVQFIAPFGKIESSTMGI